MTDPSEPPIQARHLLVCKWVDYDPHDPDGAHYSLRSLYVSLRPADDIGYPLCAESLWLFAQVYGEPGRYTTRIVLVRLADDGTDVDPTAAVYDPKPIRVRAGRFVEGVQFELPHVPFEEPGLYEFRLMLDGHPEPLAAERILLEP